MNWNSGTAAFAMGLMVSGFAANAENLSWDMANEYGETSIMGMADQVFIKAVSEGSGGTITITPHFGGSIGYKSVDQFDAVGDGALQLADTVIGSVAGIEPIFLLSSLPFLVTSDADAKLLWETALPYYKETFAKHNQILLWASPWPPAGIWAKKPVTSVADLADLKIRGWDASGVRSMTKAGATAIQISWADVVPQLAAGAINSVLTSADGGASAKFWEFLPNFTAVNYSMALNMSHMNKDVFDALTDAQRALVLDAAQMASDAAWGELSTRVGKNYEDMHAHSMTITTEVPVEFVKHLRSSADEVYADWLTKVGPDGQKILDEYTAKRGF